MPGSEKEGTRSEKVREITAQKIKQKTVVAIFPDIAVPAARGANCRWFSSDLETIGQ